MNIRPYAPADEPGWTKCRVLSFLDTSYHDDIRTTKETYDNPSLCYVAEEEGRIIGLIDVEWEETPGAVCAYPNGLGCVIWHLCVLPAYRGKGVARGLWAACKEALLQKGIHYVEVWTQDDAPANTWYERQGFAFREAYLNAYIRGEIAEEPMAHYLRPGRIGAPYGVRSLNFEAPITKKAELSKICYRLHEVRLYTLMLL